jgi:hypothetical protein
VAEDDVLAAWHRVMDAAAGPERDRQGHGDLTRQGAVRLESLRFVVRLVGGSR